MFAVTVYLPKNGINDPVKHDPTPNIPLSVIPLALNYDTRILRPTDAKIVSVYFSSNLEGVSSEKQALVRNVSATSTFSNIVSANSVRSRL